MEIEFKSGEFQDFRAVTKFHVGQIERDIVEGEVLQFDGQVARIGGSEQPLSSLRGAIKVGWLVPSSDTTSKYRPKSAQAPMRPAQGQDRKAVGVQTVTDDERDLGSVKNVRDRGDGIVKRNAVVRDDSDGSEGVTVGKIRSPAVRKTELTGANATKISQEIQRTDNTSGTSGKLVEPVAKVTTTGDVEEARVGENVEELLGQKAASTSKPAAGPAGEGDSPHLTAAEKAAKARAARLAQVSQSTAASSPAPVSAEAGTEAPVDAEDRITLVRTVLPEFEWDLTRQWRVRVKEAVEKQGDPLYLIGILAVESDAVKKHVQAALQK